MKVQLKKSQLSELLDILRKNHKENSNLYSEINEVLRLNYHVIADKLLEISIEGDDIQMLHELLKPKEE